MKLTDNLSNKRLNFSSVLDAYNKSTDKSLLTSLEFVFYINIFQEDIIIEDLLLYAYSDFKDFIIRKNYLEYRLKLFNDYDCKYIQQRQININNNKLVGMYNALLEHSFEHRDIVVNDLTSSEYSVYEFFNNIYIPIVVKNLNDIFVMHVPENYYFFLRGKRDLDRINCMLWNTFDSYNVHLYSSNIFLTKLELKKDKFNGIFSLYGFDTNENKYKFLMHFEICYFKLYNHYLTNVFDFAIKNVYYDSIYNKYGNNTYDILNDNNKINKNRMKFKRRRIDGYSRGKRMQQIKFSIENIQPKIEATKKMLDYIYDEKEIGGSSVGLENQEKENEKLFIDLNVKLNIAKKIRIKIKEGESLNNRSYLKYIESGDFLVNTNLGEKGKGICNKNKNINFVTSNKLKFIDFKKNLQELNLLKKIDERKK